MADASDRVVRFAQFSLDMHRRELRKDAGGTVPLTAKALDTLAVLVSRSGETVEKRTLMATVWPGRVLEENNLTQAIAALRRAFGTDAHDHSFIVTVPGRGYRFVAQVCETTQAAPRNARTCRPPAAPPSKPPSVAMTVHSTCSSRHMRCATCA